MFDCKASVSSEFTSQLQVTLRLCEIIDTPRSLAVSLMLTHGEYNEYLRLTTDPSLYDNHSNFADDHLVTEVLRKSPYLPTGIDREAVAVESFWISEIQCALANNRLRTSVPSWANRFRFNIAKLLGPLSSRALSYIESNMRHGPGSAIGFTSQGSVASDKFETTNTLTIDLYPFYKQILGGRWHYANDKPAEIVAGNRFTCVPKDAKTDRGICVEPLLNVYVQLGVGAYLRKRLSYFGGDLDTVADTNRDLSSVAHAYGLSTIDLSRASDTLCSELILQYFPDDWVEILALCRSHRTLIEGEWHELEKFSSMGNGYTFELETLVFRALCMTIVPDGDMSAVSVFGDDIIIPRPYAADLIAALEFLGFRVNTKKSFLAGRFFESCGTDWFDGQNVRPFHLKEFAPLVAKEDLRDDGVTFIPRIPWALQMANKLRHYAWLRGNWKVSDSRFRVVWEELYKDIPPIWRSCRVPPSLGDTGLLVSLAETRMVPARDGWEGWVVRRMKFVLRPRSGKRRKRRESVLLSSLMHDGRTAFSKGWEPVKGYLGLPVPKLAVVPPWPEGLSWGPVLGLPADPPA